MFPDNEIIKTGLLIVTGSTLRAEQMDRPLAYHLKDVIEKQLVELSGDLQIVVISDLWYLNSQSLQKIPTISVGGPGVNAVAANLYEKAGFTLCRSDLTFRLALAVSSANRFPWAGCSSQTRRRVFRCPLASVQAVDMSSRKFSSIQDAQSRLGTVISSAPSGAGRVFIGSIQDSKSSSDTTALSELTT